MPMPAKSSAAPAGGSRFQTRTEVDFVVIGSGAAGGVLAKELSTAGFSVVVLEQGPYLRPSQFRHDELGGFFNFDLLPKPSDFPTTFRKTEKDEATVQAFRPPPPRPPPVPPAPAGPAGLLGVRIYGRFLHPPPAPPKRWGGRPGGRERL